MGLEEYGELSGIWVTDPGWSRRGEFPPMALIGVGMPTLVTLHLVDDGSGRPVTRYMSYGYLVRKSVIWVIPCLGPDTKLRSWRWRLDSRQYLRIRFERHWVPLVPSSFPMLYSLGFDLIHALRFIAISLMTGGSFSETPKWLPPTTVPESPWLV